MISDRTYELGVLPIVGSTAATTLESLECEIFTIGTPTITQTLA
jgi:hypothetical protein